MSPSRAGSSHSSSWRFFSSARLVTFFHLARNEKLGENEPTASPELTTPKLDPQVTNYLLSTIREHLESIEDETLPVSTLFDQIMPVFEASSKDQTGIPIKRQQDLETFIRMHSHLFRVNGGWVTLIRNPHHNLPSPTKTPTKTTATLRLDGSPLHNPKQLQQQSLKQRVNSVVLKVNHPRQLLATNSNYIKITYNI